MRKVEILMSSYNGGQVIERQIRSILEQKDVDIKLTVRDDGSNDDTCTIIEKLSEEYVNRIRLIKGANVGWKKSFLELIFLAGEAEYYGFTDQDDFWLPEKVANSIEIMEQDSFSGIKLAHVNSICTNDKLEVQEEQQKRYALPKNRKAVIAQEYFQGCSMLWNACAMKMIKRYKPKSDLAHDFWVGTVCYYLGKVYYCEKPQFYHIRYENNSSSDGNVSAGRKKRLQMLKSGRTIYMNPANDLIEGYGELLQENDLKFLREAGNAKKSFTNRVKLVCMPGFRRESLKSTLLFKLMLLAGRY